MRRAPLAFLLAFVVTACRAARPDPLLLLVTLDTTRADALGCYGGRAGLTPVLDRLAAEGVRVADAYAHAPTTLSSHASMFTGLDPHGHRVVRNGFPLPDGIPTLAERLRAAGWDARAAVGAAVLASSTGIARGFSVFDEALAPRGPHGRPERDAAAVVDAALATLEGSEGPLALWVHFFDPHAPYEAPTAFRERWVDEVALAALGPLAEPRRLTRAVARGQAPPGTMARLRERYEAEIAWMDAQLGRLLEGLAAAGRLEEALVVVVGDHGELFGEEPLRPVGHGFDVEPPATHVPWIAWGSGALHLAPRVIEGGIASLSDVGPTVLGLLGLPSGLGTGRDLAGAFRGDPLPAERTVFLEATRPAWPRHGKAWNNLQAERGAAAEGWMLVRSPWEGVAGHMVPLGGHTGPPPAGLAGRLARALDGWDAAAPPGREDPRTADTRAALRALGYAE